MSGPTSGKKLDRQFDKLDTIFWQHDSVGCVEIADKHAANFAKCCYEEGFLIYDPKLYSFEHILKMYKQIHKL